MKYFSMFSGIGGFELGIERAAAFFGLETECVGYSEIDKHAITTYEGHFDHDNYGDITKIDADAIPDFELGVGGFPCQAFSIAGKRRGFEDTRGTLFFDVARILAAKLPQNFILENVKGLLSHDGGRTFRVIIEALTDLGYCVEWQVLNSKNFGVPQSRERVFIVGHFAGERGRTVLPASRQSNPNTTVSQSTKTAVARTFTAGGNSGGNHSGMTIIRETVTPVYQTDSRRIQELTKASSMSQRLYDPAGVAPTFSTGGASTGGAEVPRVLLDSNIRRLTPVEAERLQGFPDGWTLGSDTQRYRQCGNAVTVNVVEEIVARLIEGAA